MTSPRIADELAAFEAEVTRDWGHLSTQVAPSGTRCVGFVPYNDIHVWCHWFWAGCSNADLDLSEQRIGRAIPAAWREVLLHQNGLSLFIGGLGLRGTLPGGLNRSRIDDPLPMSFEDGNTVQRPSGPAISPEDLVVGYTAGVEVFKLLLLADGTFAKVTRYGESLVRTYPDLMTMIRVEYEAQRPNWDHDGRKRMPVK